MPLRCSRTAAALTHLDEFTVVEELQQRTLAHRTVADQNQTELIVKHQIGHTVRAAGEVATGETDDFER